MTAVEDVRTRLRARAAKKPAAEPWHFPRLEEFMLGVKVLAFDGTLTNCGWVFMQVLDQVRVYAKGTIKPKTELTGYQGTWAKAQILGDELGGLFRYLDGRWDELVVEAPPVGGGNRTESTLIAGMLIWGRCPARCRDIAPQHMSAVLLGDARMPSAQKKTATRAAVIRLIPEAVIGWNEHERDAAAIGLTHLYDLRRKMPQPVIWTG